MNLTINILFSFIEFLAGLSFADVLFRLPYEKNKRLKHMLISLFLACESGYFSTYWHQPLLTFFFTLFLWIISLVVVFQISIWYSMLIGIISALMGGGLEIVGYLVTNLISRVNLHEPTELTRNLVLFFVAVTLYVLSVYLSRKKFGFLIPNIYSKPPLNTLFIVVSSIMIASLLALTLSAYLFTGQINSIHIFVALLLLLCTSLVVVFSYQFNKKLLKDKYNRNGSQPWA